MSERTYKFTGVVIKRTKLGETDSIVTLLDSLGAQQRAVAKGSRKPSNTLSARLELYQTAEVLCAKGKNLSIVKEARHIARENDAQPDELLTLEKSVCAAPIAELLCKVTQEDLEHPRLFELVQTAFSSLERCETTQAPAICAATLLKIFAIIGLRPSLDTCVNCGSSIALDDRRKEYPFTFLDGGVLCDSCRRNSDAVSMGSDTLLWMNAFLYSTYEDILTFDTNASPASAILSFAVQWCRVHVGSTLKSVDFLLTSGIF